jgi:hypothetical protein
MGPADGATGQAGSRHQVGLTGKVPTEQFLRLVEVAPAGFRRRARLQRLLFDADQPPDFFV